MLYYDRIDICEAIDVNESSESKECDICHYWYFLDKEFKFQQDVCNGCHDVLMCLWTLAEFLNGISKNEAVNLLQKADLSRKC